MKVESNLPQILVSFDPKRAYQKKILIRSSDDAADAFRSDWDLSTINLYEEFRVMFLDRKNRVIGIRKTNIGNTANTCVNIRLILHIALATNSCSIILCHNHPSGGTLPSQADISLTDKINNACKFLEINLHDHIILSEDSYYSFRDEGILR